MCWRRTYLGVINVAITEPHIPKMVPTFLVGEDSSVSCLRDFRSLTWMKALYSRSRAPWQGVTAFPKETELIIRVLKNFWQETANSILRSVTSKWNRNAPLARKRSGGPLRDRGELVSSRGWENWQRLRDPKHRPSRSEGTKWAFRPIAEHSSQHRWLSSEGERSTTW